MKGNRLDLQPLHGQHHATEDRWDFQLDEPCTRGELVNGPLQRLDVQIAAGEDTAGHDGFEFFVLEIQLTDHRAGAFAKLTRAPLHDLARDRVA